MKKQKKGFILGFLTCTLLSVLIMNVFAAPIEKAITASYNSIKIYVDGNKIDPKDANGNTIEPFIYNGTTYLPVRAVGEAIGKNVEWDAKNFSVYLGKRPDGTGASMWLTNLTPVMSRYSDGSSTLEMTNKEYRFLTSSDLDNYGNKYGNGHFYSLKNYFMGSTRYMYNEYATDMKYDSLSGTIALSNSTKNTTDMATITIDGVMDGKRTLLYESPVIMAGKRPVDFNVNISGWSNIRIWVWVCDSEGNVQDSNGKNYYARDDINIIVGNIGLN